MIINLMFYNLSLFIHGGVRLAKSSQSMGPRDKGVRAQRV
jgi:hypothetical protein